MFANSPSFCRILILGCLLASCRTTSSSNVLVTNPQGAGNLYPEVVELIADLADGMNARCSGTFIEEDTVLTAAHCLFDHRGQAVRRLVYQAANGTEYPGTLYPSREYSPSGSMIDRVTSDLGLVRFDRRLATKIATIAKKEPVKGDAITLVGYGVTDLLTETGDGDKNYGRNEVQLVKENVLYLAGFSDDKIPGVQQGVASVSGPGDSGGAIFNASGELIAVISAGSKLDVTGPNGEALARSVAVIVNHPASQSMIDDIKTDIKAKKALKTSR